MKRLKLRKLKRADVWQSVLAGALIFSLLVNIYFLFLNFNRNKVVRVVDGDSFETKDGRRIRLLGVDAPEINNCMGVEARGILEILIKDKIVRLKDQVKDDYGRNLANVHSISTFVNYEMLKRGLGRYVGNENKLHNQMRKAYVYAKENKLGIFSSVCRQMVDSDDDCSIKANIRHGVKTYHLPECRNYKQVIIDTSYGDKWFCREEEATKEGFKKAGEC